MYIQIFTRGPPVKPAYIYTISVTIFITDTHNILNNIT